jgi:hypothetical protein
MIPHQSPPVKQTSQIPKLAKSRVPAGLRVTALIEAVICRTLPCGSWFTLEQQVIWYPAPSRAIRPPFRYRTGLSTGPWAMTFSFAFATLAADRAHLFGSKGNSMRNLICWNGALIVAVMFAPHPASGGRKAPGLGVQEAHQGLDRPRLPGVMPRCNDGGEAIPARMTHVAPDPADDGPGTARRWKTPRCEEDPDCHRQYPGAPASAVCPPSGPSRPCENAVPGANGDGATGEKKKPGRRRHPSPWPRDQAAPGEDALGHPEVDTMECRPSDARGQDKARWRRQS